MSVVVDFQEVIWSPMGLKLPIVEKPYLLTQVQISKADIEDVEPGHKLYTVTVGRSREVVCFLRIKEEDLNELRVLQNLIFKSKL